MENIYKSKAYIFITVGALILLLLSAYFILTKGITFGVEFKGGTLVLADSSKPVDVSGLEAALKERFGDVKIDHYKTPYGYRVEIEIPNPKEIDELEVKRSIFGELLKNYSLALSREDEKATFYREKIEAMLNEMSKETGIEYNKTGNPTDYSDAFNEMYTQYRRNFEMSVKSVISKYISAESFSFKSVSPVLSERFLSKVKDVAILSAILSTAFVFFVFRNPLPSIAVLIGAASDLIIALGFMSLFNIPFTLASFAALLMIIGYSLDTDMLLTMRVVKRKREDPADSAWDSLKTGSTMSLTAIISFGTLFVVAYILKIPIYYQISSVALAGLFGDLWATWGINAVILYHGVKRKR